MLYASRTDLILLTRILLYEILNTIMNKINHKISLRIFGALLLFGGLGISLVLVQESQDIRGKAMEHTVTQTKNAQATNTTDIKHPEKISYLSDRYGYSLTYDNNYWTELNGSAENKKDLKSLQFKLNEQIGIAEIAFEAYDITNKQITLDDLTSSLIKIRQSILPKEISLIKSEKLKRSGKEIYKLTYEEKILQGTSQYYEYIFIDGERYFSITAKYVHYGESAVISENFIDTLIQAPSTAFVKGTTDMTDLDTTLDETKITELNTPSVVNIVHLYCVKMRITKSELLKHLKPSYSYCTGGKGSGFMITKDGHIGTNGHVIRIYPEQALMQSILKGGSPAIDSFLADLIRMQLSSTGKEISERDITRYISAYRTPSYANSIIYYIYSLIEAKSLAFEEEESKFFLKLGNDPFMIDKDKIKQGDYLDAVKLSEGIYEATRVDYEFPNRYSADAVLRKKITTGSDVGILKLENPDDLSFPGIKFGVVDKLKKGNDLLIIGYPGLVEGSASKSALLSYESSSEPSVTRGIVSSIKTDQDGRKLIQTDASMDHGNSGGPAFDKNGHVVGIATYGLQSTGGNYNFLRSITDLEDLMKKNNIQVEESPAYIAWQDGLLYSWNGYHRKSIKEFNTLKKLYSIHPSVVEYIDEAEIAIDEGKDKDGAWGSLSDTIPSWILIGIPALMLLIGATGVTYLLVQRRKMRSEAENTDIHPPIIPFIPPGSQQ